MEPAPEEVSAASQPHSSPTDLPPPPVHPHNTDAPSPAPSTNSRPVSGVVPPYWQRHDRNASRASQNSLMPGITLEDHTADESETSRGLWARSVSITDYSIVQGKTGVGAYVVWNCTVHTLDVSRVFLFLHSFLSKRCREDRSWLDWGTLSSTICASDSILRSRMLGVHFRLCRRRVCFLSSGLSFWRIGGWDWSIFLSECVIFGEGFLLMMGSCILLNPEFSSSPIVKDFLFGRMSW